MQNEVLLFRATHETCLQLPLYRAGEIISVPALEMNSPWWDWLINLRFERVTWEQDVLGRFRFKAMPIEKPPSVLVRET